MRLISDNVRPGTCRNYTSPGTHSVPRSLSTGLGRPHLGRVDANCFYGGFVWSAAGPSPLTLTPLCQRKGLLSQETLPVVTGPKLPVMTPSRSQRPRGTLRGTTVCAKTGGVGGWTRTTRAGWNESRTTMVQRGNKGKVGETRRSKNGVQGVQSNVPIE